MRLHWKLLELQDTPSAKTVGDAVRVPSSTVPQGAPGRRQKRWNRTAALFSLINTTSFFVPGFQLRSTTFSMMGCNGDSGFRSLQEGPSWLVGINIPSPGVRGRVEVEEARQHCS